MKHTKKTTVELSVLVGVGAVAASPDATSSTCLCKFVGIASDQRKANENEVASHWLRCAVAAMNQKKRKLNKHEKLCTHVNDSTQHEPTLQLSTTILNEYYTFNGSKLENKKM